MEPEKFKKMLKAGFIFKGTPLINPILAQFKPEGAIILGFYSNIVGARIRMDKEFFTEYECTKEEVISFPYTVLERMGWGFKDEIITISSTDKKVIIKGGADSYDYEIENMPFPTSPFGFKEHEKGTIPDDITLETATVLDVKDLILPPGQLYAFKFKDGKLSAGISDSGNFVRRFSGEVIAAAKDLKVTLDGDFYTSIVSNLDGKALFVLDPDKCIFSEKGENISKTFMLGPRV